MLSTIYSKVVIDIRHTRLIMQPIKHRNILIRVPFFTRILLYMRTLKLITLYRTTMDPLHSTESKNNELINIKSQVL